MFQGLDCNHQLIQSDSGEAYIFLLFVSHPRHNLVLTDLNIYGRATDYFRGKKKCLQMMWISLYVCVKP